MSILDNGGFDVLLEVSQAAAAGLMRNVVSIPDQSQPFNSQGVTGNATIHITPADAKFSNGNAVEIVLSLAGSTLALTSWPLPVLLSTVDNIINLDARVAVGDLVQAAALSAVVDTSPDAAHATPRVTVTLDRNTILASTPVTILLGYIVVGQGAPAMLLAREAILTTLQSQLETSVRATLANAPIVQTLLTVPAAFAPFVPAPMLSTPGTQNPVRVDTTVGSLRVGALLGGSAANPNLITRSALRTSTTTGTPIDALALIISNACLLRDFARPAVGNALGLTAAGFAPFDPFFWTGSASTSIGGTPATISFASVSVNESAQLVVVFTFAISALGGGITAHGTATIAVNVGLSSSGAGIAVTLTPQAAVISGAHVDIAWWVYLLSALTLGTHGLVALAVADAILDGAVSGGAMSIPPVTMTLPLPAGVPPIFVTGLSLFQGDAPRRVLPFPAILGAGRDHDLIATFAL